MTKKNNQIQDPLIEESWRPEQWQPVLMLLYAALGLWFLEFFGKVEFFTANFPQYAHLHKDLYPQLWWAITTISVYLIPSLFIIFLFKERLRDYGVRLDVKKKHLALYFGMYLIVLPFVIYASTRTDFQNIYPFFRGAYHGTTAEILVWEIAYLSQFVALEFFFRGFLVIGLEKYIGRLSVWVAMVPYMMIHFHKPPLEAFGAIIAGVILGEVARRTRSILGGIIVHVGVALTMDILALTR